MVFRPSSVALRPSRRWLFPLLVALLLVGCGAKLVGDDKIGAPGKPLPVPGPQVVFPTVAVNVELARTDPEREKGLGGHAPLGERDGMLFIFDQAATWSFWMKGMTFDLDMLWLNDGKVVHLERDVPAPRPGQTDRELPVYTPKAVARYVLEVNAGFAAQHGIQVGTPAELRGL